jgi:Lon protease-like protein
MFEPAEWPLSPGEFSGRVRLFPLPHLVLFPHVIQPLHVFEPRYRAMMEDALRGDKLLTLALLEPGWENDYEGRPAIFPVACLGRITTWHRLPDGRFNLLLAGLRRVRILRELNEPVPFRVAQCEVLEDQYGDYTAEQTQHTRARLLEAFLRMLRRAGNDDPHLRATLDKCLSLGALTDVVAYTLGLDLALKRQLLEETRVDRRAHLLLTLLQPGRGRPFPGGKFPPEFSNN